MTSIAQAVNDGLLRTEASSLPSRGVRWSLARTRRALVLVADPLVTYRIGAASIRLPLSHNLPHFQKAFPNYALNLGRIAAVALRAHPDLAAVDVGANVGDSVAILRTGGHMPVLAIEGDRRFFSILEQNARFLGPDVYLRLAMVGTSPGHGAGAMERRGGSAHYVEDRVDPNQVPFERLSRLIEGTPEVAGRRLLIKIDTDGLDSAILKSEEEFLAKRRPVVFFEYDPFHFERYKDDGFAVFAALRRAGYSDLLVYENTGDLASSVALDDDARLRELHEIYVGRGGERYADICAFHRQDTKLFGEVMASEREFFSRLGSAQKT